MKDIQVKYRKLGKEKSDGLAWIPERLIEIDIRLKGIEHLEILIHELIHIQNPKWSEIKVKGHAKQLAEILWQQGYRRVDT